MNWSLRDFGLGPADVGGGECRSRSARPQPERPVLAGGAQRQGASGPPEVLRTKAIKYAALKPSGTGARTLASIINGVTTRGLRWRCI